MREKEIIDHTTIPITVKRIVHDIQKLGVQVGDCIIVHSSMSKLG